MYGVTPVSKEMAPWREDSQGWTVTVIFPLLGVRKPQIYFLIEQTEYILGPTLPVTKSVSKLNK